MFEAKFFAILFISEYELLLKITLMEISERKQEFKF